MKNKWFTPSVAISILVAVYAVGLLGFLFAPGFFQKLTPLNIVCSAILLFLFHKNWSPKFLLYTGVAAISGFLVEWLGVTTGFVFGTYSYGSGLGWKLFEIPLLIGLNWLVLLYCVGTMAGTIKVPWWFQAFIGAALMVLIDLLLEPFAIKFDLWSWASATIPFQNYMAWFIISLLLLLPFHYYQLHEQNKVAGALYFIQFVFFLFIFLFV
ncbi:hypothetical protein BH09BAC1_BH09BAC1_18400 [soil metagenome]